MSQVDFVGYLRGQLRVLQFPVTNREKSRDFLRNKEATQVIIRTCQIGQPTREGDDIGNQVRGLAFDVLSQLTNDKGENVQMLLRNQPELLASLTKTLSTHMQGLDYDLQRKQLHVVYNILLLEPAILPSLMPFVIELLTDKPDWQPAPSVSSFSFSSSKLELQVKALSLCDNLCSIPSNAQLVMTTYPALVPTLVDVIINGDKRNNHIVSKQITTAIAVLIHFSKQPAYRNVLVSENPQLAPHLASLLFKPKNKLIVQRACCVLSNLADVPQLRADLQEAVRQAQDSAPGYVQITPEAKALMDKLSAWSSSVPSAKYALVNDNDDGVSGDQRTASSPPRPPTAARKAQHLDEKEEEGVVFIDENETLLNRVLAAADDDDLFSQHAAKLVPWMLSKVQATEAEEEASSLRIMQQLYNLSCSQSSSVLLQRFRGDVDDALSRVCRGAVSPVTRRRALLAQMAVINLWDMEAEVPLPREVNIDRVFDVLLLVADSSSSSSKGDDESGWSLNAPLLAMSRLTGATPPRTGLWSRHGPVLLTTIGACLVRLAAGQSGDDDEQAGKALVTGLVTLRNFAALGEAREWMRRQENTAGVVQELLGDGAGSNTSGLLLARYPSQHACVDNARALAKVLLQTDDDYDGCTVPPPPHQATTESAPTADISLPPPATTDFSRRAKWPRYSVPKTPADIRAWLGSELQGDLGGNTIVQRLVEEGFSCAAELESLSKWRALDIRGLLQLSMHHAMLLQELLRETFRS